MTPEEIAQALNAILPEGAVLSDEDFQNWLRFWNALERRVQLASLVNSSFNLRPEKANDA